uniref:Fibronectin type-III domain-containing protein n=1 Tax=Oryza glumipatula TaxID=40148 RepID=A0A0D9ZU50_9ORYZ
MTKATPVKASKNLQLQKQSPTNLKETNGHVCKKEVVNGECPVRDVKCISTWICKNLACKAVVTSEDSFCKRCSCCICHQFDDNKDPSLWLVCASENDDKNCCGSSCHIECALQHKRVGCFNLGNIIQLDGSYSCALCGKVSGILGYWKRQLVIAKDARRVDMLCHRIYLSYRLLGGTTRFKELHGIIEDAKAKLESEVGPLDGMSAKMARGIVSRLPAGSDLQKLCSLAIERADELLSSPDLHLRDSLPAACRFRFVEITSSSIVIILKETPLPSSDTIRGYKLWYWKSREEPSMEEPVVLSKDQRKVLVFNLAPCTLYSFRIISFTDDGILGHSESKCYTGSKELLFKRTTQNVAGADAHTHRREKTQAFKSTGFKIRDVGKILRQAWTEEGRFEGFCEDMHEASCDRSVTDVEQTENSEQGQLLSGACRKLQFSTFSVPDLNVEAPVPMDISPDKCYNSKIVPVRSNDSGGSETCAVGRSAEAEPPAVESRPEGCEQDGASTICREKQLARPRELDEDFEYCVQKIRMLECKGHIDNDFRMKFLTWFSLRSTENDRRVVTTFIKTLINEPSGLAEQLVDSFGEAINCKRQRNGFCNELWHYDKGQ